ncbi:hypothetical protein [Vibrio sp. 03_296]|uniref:hypothetical protein n=1 Tax=Vibrio sp. 03_296 TaxID=2024409 RepID=UPI002D7E9600|nr:hypothetical protein [Vibrio sp. 03_296]
MAFTLSPERQRLPIALASAGKLSGRVIPEGMGDARPLVSNETAEGKSINRRVEIDLLVQTQSKMDANNGERLNVYWGKNG